MRESFSPDNSAADFTNQIYEERIERSVKDIQNRFTEKPELLLVLGSGLGALAERVEQAVNIPYEAITGFPQSTVPGHAGQLILGYWQNRCIAVMQGRFHYYEGHAMTDVVLPIRVMQKIGVKTLILTNAAGGMNQAMKPGDLMLIRDHIGLWAESPLRGANLDSFGPRFPDQSQVYNRELGNLALQCAANLHVTLHEGTYVFCKGPQFETPAEIRLLQLLGASAAGMSTVPEAIVAAHGGMKTLAISCITNLAAGLSASPLSHEEVLETGARASADTIRLLDAIMNSL